MRSVRLCFDLTSSSRRTLWASEHSLTAAHWEYWPSLPTMSLHASPGLLLVRKICSCSAGLLCSQQSHRVPDWHPLARSLEEIRTVCADRIKPWGDRWLSLRHRCTSWGHAIGPMPPRSQVTLYETAPSTDIFTVGGLRCRWLEVRLRRLRCCPSACLGHGIALLPHDDLWMNDCSTRNSRGLVHPKLFGNIAEWQRQTLWSSKLSLGIRERTNGCAEAARSGYLTVAPGRDAVSGPSLQLSFPVQGKLLQTDGPPHLSTVQ